MAPGALQTVNMNGEMCIRDSLHSYETPCIVALPIERGDADFLAWITASTHPEE